MTPTRLPNGSITPSIASAARILGVCEGTIRAHLDRNGDLNSVGETARRKITFEGVTYPSVSECARVTGLTRAAIYWALGEGRNKPTGRTDVTNSRAALAAWTAYERSKHT